MQNVRTNATAIAALALGAVVLSGCATKDFVNKQVSAVDTRLQGTQSDLQNTQGQVAQQQTQLSSLDQTARDALERATAAGKLAEGKFLYSEVLSDDSMKFPVSKAALSPEAQARLDAFVDKLKTDNRNVYVEVQGHTDATGNDAINMKLGEERAEAVRLFLNQQGVALNRMSTISYGETAPVADNKTRDGRAQNRRVVVEVLS